MSKVRTNILEGYSYDDIIQIPTSVSGEYVQELFDGSYGVTYIKPGDIISKGPWVDARAYGTDKNESTIAAAITDIGALSRTLVLAPGVWNINGSLTIPANVTTHFLNGATVNSPVASSIVFNGAVLAGPYRIFTGSGTITVGSKTVLKYSEWDGTTGNTVTFQAFAFTPSSAPTSDYHIANKKYVDDLIAALDIIPAGVYFPYAGSVAPAGFLLCDGSAVSRTTYATLFAVTGVLYGVGDGSLTFNVPDLRTRIPVGKSALNANFTTLGQTGGTETHTLTENELAHHSHSFIQCVQGGTYAGGGSGPAAFYIGSSTTGESGGNVAHNNLQPYLVCNYIIKT